MGRTFPESSNKSYLTEEQKNHYQKRISHFLKGHRMRHNLTGEELAKIMGLSIATFRALEGKKPVGRMINSIEFLASLYSHENMSLSEFCIYLDKTTQGSLSDDLKLERKLFPWEKYILDAFEVVSMLYRREFIHICAQLPIEKYIKTILKLHRLDDEEYNKIDGLLDSFLKIKDVTPGIYK